MVSHLLCFVCLLEVVYMSRRTCLNNFPSNLLMNGVNVESSKQANIRILACFGPKKHKNQFIHLKSKRVAQQAMNVS